MTGGPNALRVLIVDDDDDLRWALQLLITSLGHHPSMMSRAHDVLAFALSGAPHPTTEPMVNVCPWDVAMIDLKLPDMEGLELIQRLRSPFPRLPCILVSGFLYGDDPLVQGALGEGLVQGFLPKPFIAAELRALFTKLGPTAPRFLPETV